MLNKQGLMALNLGRTRTKIMFAAKRNVSVVKIKFYA